MADYSKLTKRELIMTLYARDLMLENERKHLEEYKQSLKETIDHYEKYCSEINHQNVMVYAAARNYEDKCKLLQDQLALTQKALELACKWINDIQEMDSDCPIYADCFRVEKDCDNWDCGICDCSKFAIEHFKTKAKEMIKSE